MKNVLEEEAVVSAVELFKFKCNLDPLRITFASARPASTSFCRTQDVKKAISKPDVSKSLQSVFHVYFFSNAMCSYIYDDFDKRLIVHNTEPGYIDFKLTARHNPS